MALSNRDRIDRMFQVLAPALDDFISSVIGQASPALGANWTQLVQGKDVKNGAPATKLYDPQDPQVQFRMLTEGNITGGYQPGWYPFNQSIGKAGEAFANELRQVRNDWAHNAKTFTDDDAYRALDTGERLLKLIGAAAEADEVRAIRLNLRRVTADKDDKKVLKAAASNPEATGLMPWRQVLQPHEDVATGNFHAAEFAADLYKVASGGEVDADYADPVEFFKRTYLTEGLRDLIGRAVRRLAGDDNASPVTNLQTNFGGGKTHSMLALWHLAAGLPVGAFPQETQELLTASGYTGQKVNRVAIVGNELQPSGSDKDDGTHVNTIWGELAWQLGGSAAYEIVSEADRQRTHPGAALHTLLAAYSPAVILIDEWVAYARALVGRDDLAGGTFDDQFTFAQTLTEAAKGTSGVMLAISIPASNTGAVDEYTAGSAEEVGGTHGLEALRRLQRVVSRVADQWHPAKADESYHIVKQRLFALPDATALAQIAATAKAYVEMYRKYTDDFPREARDPAYEGRIRLTYPIHPELFDTLYEDWSSLERFQRTRGVLRLMSTVIHALWMGEDSAPLIMPGSIPIAAANVNSELAHYLPDSWKAIIDADVDGPNSEPVRIDQEKPLFGQRSLTKRLARTVFFGAAPTIAPGSTHKGIGTQRVFLGTSVPGDVPGNFHSALATLGDRATYFYSGQGKYWYDVQPNITRSAKDQAERLHREDVWAEILRRLADQGKVRGGFAGVHVGPEDHADIPDTEEARLVILHPRFVHRSKRGVAPSGSAASEFVSAALEHRGTASRTNRNMLVFLAPDESQMESLEAAVRDYLGWSYVLGSADLDLTDNQKAQAAEKKSAADSTVGLRLLGTFQWALHPKHLDGVKSPATLTESKVEGVATSLAERVTSRLARDGDLATQHSPTMVRLAIDSVPTIWSDGHVSLGDLWELYARYPYMPRLRDRDVLADALAVGHDLVWQVRGFALAESFDGHADAASRYAGLWLPEDRSPAPAGRDSVLIVKPDLAQAQRAAELAAITPPPGTDPGPGPEPGPGPGPGPGPMPPSDPPPGPVGPTRFFGSIELNPARYTLDFKQVADEILAHLARTGVDLSVRIEIEAVKPDGFEESTIRTVRENATVLKFDQSGFESS